MSYTDKNTELGNHVAFAVNNKGTGRCGLPTAIAEIGKTETASATADPRKLKAMGRSKLRRRIAHFGKWTFTHR